LLSLGSRFEALQALLQEAGPRSRLIVGNEGPSMSINKLLINLRWHLYDKWRATRWEKFERRERISKQRLTEWEQYQAEQKRNRLEEPNLDDQGNPIIWSREELSRYIKPVQRRELEVEYKLVVGGRWGSPKVAEMTDAQLRDEIVKTRQHSKHRRLQLQKKRQELLKEEGRYHRQRAIREKTARKNAAKKAAETRKRNAAKKAAAREAADTEGEDSIQQQESELPRCYSCGDSEDVRQTDGSNYAGEFYCSHCEHHIDDDGICYSPDCDTCQEKYEEATERGSIRDGMKFDRRGLEDDDEEEEEEDDMDMSGFFNV